MSIECIDTWSKILTKIEDCKMMIKAPSEDAEIAKNNFEKI